MAEIHTRIEAFFESYKSHFNKALARNDKETDDAFSGSFETCFVASGPQGVQCDKNDKSFIAAMKQGMEFYRSIGSKSMQIRNNEVTVLDSLHAISKISWRYVYRKDEKEGFIDFYVFYFLLIKPDTIKIFGYITGDEQSALRQHGLI